RGQDAAVPQSGRAVRLPGIHGRSVLLVEDGLGLYRGPAVGQEGPGAVPGASRADRPTVAMAGTGGGCGAPQPPAGRLGELLLPGDGHGGLRQGDSPCLPSAPSVAGAEVQSAGVEMVTLLGPLPARGAGAAAAPATAARLLACERMSPCPRAGCGNSARPV